MLKKLKNLAGVVDHVVQDLAVVADVVQLVVVAHFEQGQDLAAVALDLEKIEKVHVKVPIKVYKKVTSIVMSKSRQIHVRVTSKSSQSNIKVTSESRQSHVKVTSESRQSHVIVTSESRQSHVKATSESRQSDFDMTLT